MKSLSIPPSPFCHPKTMRHRARSRVPFRPLQFSSYFVTCPPLDVGAPAWFEPRFFFYLGQHTRGNSPFFSTGTAPVPRETADVPDSCQTVRCRLLLKSSQHPQIWLVGIPVEPHSNFQFHPIVQIFQCLAKRLASGPPGSFSNGLVGRQSPGGCGISTSSCSAG